MIFKISLFLLLILPAMSFTQNKGQFLTDSLSNLQCLKLNKAFNKQLNNKDFCSMKVAFFSSPGGTVQRLSSDFFYELDNQNQNDTIDFPVSLMFFNEQQKSMHGYDVAVIWWSKNPSPNTNRRLIKLTK